MKYRLLIDYEVIEFIESLPRKDQRLLRNRFVAIQAHPGRYSDYPESDSAGRRVAIHICGKYAIKFWEDHADQHVKILDVHFADRSRP
jgi:mRNA-degrading endonuclease RelE of RelBE toxin-antitoxin system